jgi:hypothetical protein
MRSLAMKSVLAAAVVVVVTAGGPVAVASAAGPSLTRYAVRADAVVTETLANGPCGAPAVVTLDQHLSAAVAATEAGLSDAEVLGLVQDDPDGILRQVTVTTAGSVVLSTGGHRYVGTFAMWFGGTFMPNGMYEQSGTFSLEATSELGTRLLVHSGGHDLDGSDGIEKMFNQHGKVTGCLP